MKGEGVRSMKQLFREILIAGIFGLVIPVMVLHFGMRISENIVPEEAPLPVSTNPPAVLSTLTIQVRTEDGTVQTMELDDYLVGVLLAEMPSSFEQEAKKAQIVVARTYAMRAMTEGGKHDDAAVCMESACCQGFLSQSSYLEQGGNQSNISLLQRLVSETDRQVLVYEGALIEATYFSCSGGLTEDAVAVWGKDVPYLKATESPGEEHAAHHTDQVSFSRGELESALDIVLGDSLEEWIGAITYTAGGGVKTMEIGGKTFSGTELRSRLDLRSTAFSVLPVGDSLAVTTRGFGHRVGMSQYGADAMAATGSNYREILSHYYQGTTLVVYELESH